MLKIEKININNIPVFGKSVKKQDSKTIAPPENSKKLTDELDNFAINNTIFIKNSPKLVDEKVRLIEGYSINQLNQNLSNLSPKNMVLVHATDYFPKNGKITTSANASKLKTGKINPKYKIHCAINHFVESHNMGNWDSKKYVVLMPMDKIMETVPKENILGGLMIDFFIQGDIQLPKNSVIIKTGCNDIPKGKMRISKLANNIKLIESSRLDTANFANEIVEKMGYSKYSPNISYSEATNKLKINKEEYKYWDDFCKKYNFENTIHSHSPWGRSENLFTIIWLLNEVSDSWVCYKKDYRNMLLSAIKDIEDTLPEGKKLDYDIKKLASIIKNTETPKEACDKIEEELNIKYSNDYFEAKKIMANSKSLQEAERKLNEAGSIYSADLIKQANKELAEDYEENYGEYSEDIKEGLDWAYYIFLSQTGIDLNSKKVMENIEFVE